MFLGPVVRVGAWVRWKRNGEEEKKWASWRKEQGEDAVAERRDIWGLWCALWRHRPFSQVASQNAGCLVCWTELGWKQVKEYSGQKHRIKI